MTSANPDFDVVLLGQNIGVYTYARALHERYGIKPTVIAYGANGPLWHTSLCDVVALGPNANLETMLEAIRDYAAKRRAAGVERPVILTANSDGFVRFLARNRVELEADFILPFPPLEKIELVSDKAEFAALAEEVGMGHPRTVVVDLGDGEGGTWSAEPITEFEFPVVAKASESSEYEGLKFAGKKKVYIAKDQAELDGIWKTVRAAGFRGRFVVQEMVPGDDTNMRWINCYRDRNGVMTSFASAQVLLEEHTPVTLGNPAAMITGPMPQAMEQVRRLLDHLDWVGFANFDGKVDPRDGELKVFEFNPRMGRANYAATAAGENVAVPIVEDMIEGKQVEPRHVTREVLFSILPVKLLLKYLHDPSLVARVKRLAKQGVAKPLSYDKDSLIRRGYAVVAELNHIRKFRRYYPWGQEHDGPTAG